MTLTALAALGFWWARPAPLELEWVHPGRGDLVSTVVNTRAGTIKSCQRAGLSLPGGGIVEQIRVVAGEKVSKGQPLLTLWNEDLKAELARARATAVLNRVLREQSCVDAEFKAREAKRLITLRERNLTSKTLSEQAESLAAHSRLACEAAASQSAVDEAQIAAARRFYNANVRNYNTKIDSFPSNILAGMYHFEKATYFEVNDPAVRQAPGVNFGEISQRPTAAPQVGQGLGQEPPVQAPQIQQQPFEQER